MTMMPACRTTRRIAATLVGSALSLLMLGCGTGLAPTSDKTPTKVVSNALNGRVRGGQQPISGAVIQLYAVGVTGLKSASTPLIAATVVTDADGDFSITGDWNCTSNTAVYGVNPLLYIVSTGGNPGLISGTDNAAIVLMGALGPCSGLNASTSIQLNELTTVAAAYALAPFMSDAAHVGASGTNATGLVNAFNTANLLVDTSRGTSPGSALQPTAAAPVAELNTLADALAACVNSSGTGGACSALTSAATPTGGTTPSDVVGVVLNIASNPSLNAATFYNMVPPSPPFQPILQSAPNDWTVALKFTGGGLNAPAALAIDATGDVWVANAAGNSVTELSPSGALLTGSGGYTGSGNIFGAQGIAVDKSGNVWLADTLLSSVVELTVANGAIQSSTSFTAGGISGPIGIATDSQNNIWVANFAGASVTELNSAGSPVGSTPLTANGQLQGPFGIAVDPGGDVWVTDNLAADVVEFGNNQSLLSANGLSDGNIFAPEGIALDSSSRAWIAYQGTNAAAYYTNGLNNTGSSTPYVGGGLSMPAAVAIDGQGTVWIANNVAAGSLSKLALTQSTPLSPSTGLGSLNAPSGIAIDASGSIWTANAGDNSVSEFIGIAVPASTPLAASTGP